MFTEYVAKAMQQAEYEQMEDGNWWGQVTPPRYTWATGPTKEACAKELRDVVEDWLIDAIACDHSQSASGRYQHTNPRAHPP
jgi:predicted RNase H-like HicB family nuclease